MPIRTRRFWLSYIVALLAVAAATALGRLMGAYFSTPTMLVAYFAAVGFAGWYGGFGPAALATATSYVAANWLFVDPRDAFVFNSTAFAFVFVCLSLALFGELAKRARQRAMTHAEQFKLVVENIDDGFVVVDSDWRLTYVNQAAQDLNARHLLAGHAADPNELFPLSIGPAGRAMLQAGADQHVTVEFEHHQSAWQEWFEIRGSPTEDGGLAIYFRNITDRKAADEELRRLASIVESSEDAVIGMDLAGHITSWNDAAVKLYGYTAPEVIGRAVSLLIPPDHDNEEAELLAKVRRGESARHFDTVRLGKSGRRLDVSLSVSPIKDSTGTIVGCSKIARDITDRKHAENALREADRRKDDFLALLGHELRNPLAAIVNGAQVLHELGTPDPAAAEVQAIIQRQAGHMSRLIDDLLDISRIVRGKIILHPQRIDLGMLARQCCEDHRAQAGQVGVEVTCRLPDEPLYVEGDAVRIAQVMDNLVNNALKFTDREGTLDVIVRKEPDQDFAHIEVRDTGIGMTPKTVASLFEPFAQAEGTLGRSCGGLGLGLAVVKGLVELHRGTVTAGSAGPGRGATFLVRLPLAAEPVVDKAEPARPQTADEQLHVLIIDDNPDAALPMSKLLTMRGHDVDTALDARSGLAKARSRPPDVILCDIGLPGDMDGYGVAQAIRADKSLRSTYLVAVTGFGQDEDRRRATDAGFDRHLTKPVGFGELDALLAQIGNAGASSTR